VRFADRTDAGRHLAARLAHLRSPSTVVLGLPRGGVPVAEAVAAALGAPLDVLIVRKIGVPHQPELAMGAIGEGGVRVMNEAVIRRAGVTADAWESVERREWAELGRRVAAWRPEHPRIELTGRQAVIVDDGLATGSTARVACRVARAAGAERVVLAVPVAPRGWERDFAEEADELVALHTPEAFMAVGQWYRDFDPTPDAEVVACLDRSRRREVHHVAGGAGGEVTDREVDIDLDDARLGGHLTVPEKATAIVLFAHGSGSSRHSPRNTHVASILNDAGLGTLLFDLLSAEEAGDRRHVFDIDLLARRLTGATAWLQRQRPELATGYFGASTGAAAALAAAARPDCDVRAVVSRGGRPDLAGPLLASVRAPTLLIVGGADHAVVDLNRQAASQLRCAHRLEIVPGASHLFEEPGTLDTAAALARDWFLAHLATDDEAGPRLG
jgi:putative phosphoribosyl transferase